MQTEFQSRSARLQRDGEEAWRCFWMSLQLLGPIVSPGGSLTALNPFLKGTSQWCTVLYYNVHSNIYRCVIILSSGLFIRMRRKDCVELLPSPKACNVLRCDCWKWKNPTGGLNNVPVCFAGWWWIEEERREKYKSMKMYDSSMKSNAMWFTGKSCITIEVSISVLVIERLSCWILTSLKEGKLHLWVNKCELNIIWRETVFVLPNDLSEFVK